MNLRQSRSGQDSTHLPWLFASNLASNAGDGFVYAIAPLLALRATDDPVAVATVLIVAQLVQAAVAVPAGHLIDSVDRHKLVVFSQIGRSALVAAAAVVVVSRPMPLIALAVGLALFGAAELLVDGGMRAMIPALVSSSRLEWANSRMFLGQQVVQAFIALPIATALLAWTSVGTLAVTAVLLAVAAIALAPLRPTDDDDREVEQASESAPDEVSGLLAGFRALWSDRPSRTLVVVNTLGLFVLQFSQGSLIYYYTRVIKVSEGFVGVVLGAEALGAICGTAVAPWIIDRLGRGRAFAASAVALAVSLPAVGLVPAGPRGVGLLIGIGLASSLVASWWNIIQSAAFQRRIPIAMLGRASGALFAVSAVAVPLATILGAFVTRSNPRLPWLVGGVVFTVLIVLWGRSTLAAIRTLYVEAPGPEPVE